MKRTLVSRRFVLGLSLVGTWSCTAPGGPGSEPFAPPVSRSERDAAGTVSTTASARCLPAAAEALPARVVDVGEQETNTVVERPVFVSDLFRRFATMCGACHVEGSFGKFHVEGKNFTDLDEMKVLAAIRSDDPLKFMPPPSAFGKKWAERLAIPNDPVVALAEEIEQWAAQKKPSDVFKVKVRRTGFSESYALPEEMARQQTNLGNCIPGRGLVATQPEAMDEKDAFFAEATELPENLDQTDLTTMDGAVLASKGVVAFAPAYPLWSEDSGKIRAIRVPRGTSVKFDKATQKFSIPVNTRFYKTFLKKIRARNGKEIWRKIETRLIVARPDDPEAEPSMRTGALFGTYAWNEEETEAKLVRDPLRNGDPFADRVFTYAVDEKRYQEILDGLAAKPGDLVTELEKPVNKGVVRHYAIPGKQRCIECHMGSPSADFVLGFTPLQIRRRPKGEAGVYEEVGPDELNQLQRLIDYGIITGISSPSDIRGLEQPQGPRKFRNQYELTAQAYLLGNCSHCHNPRGFPSVKSPELIEALDLLPGEEGGVFQFPLERMSPLRKRGVSQDVDIPYITPSLRDYPAGTADMARTPAGQGGLGGMWTLKWVDCLKGGFVGLGFCDLFNPDDIRFVSAPWRSLVYRNVDTPYIYADDFTVFPHMPRHSAGFDCRAPRIMGEWMVSIPALHKKETAAYEDNVRQGPLDTTAQPYEEVKPGDPQYLLALEGVSERLHEYRNGKRYGYCPDRSDILIREALTTTDARRLVPPDRIQYLEGEKGPIVMPIDSVPDRAHFVPSDLTEVRGNWTPRRGDWEERLVNPKQPAASSVEPNAPWLLRGLRIPKELRDYALAPIPFGAWKQKPDCEFDGIPTADTYPSNKRLKWMDSPGAALKPKDRIYEITPGGAVFANICVNCHGPQADSKGLLAEAISEMTGGNARVANFRDGLLATNIDLGLPNIEAVFGKVAKDTSTPGLMFTANDWAARYLSWMALGGTERTLPSSILAIISASRVMGLPRKYTTQASANMLASARAFCAQVLAWEDDLEFDRYFAAGEAPRDWGKHNTSLLDVIGDAEMWIRLCTIGNRPVVRVPRKDDHGWSLNLHADVGGASFFWSDEETKPGIFTDHYGKNPVMNHRGDIDPDGIRPDNLMPTCIRKEVHGQLKNQKGQPIPACPDSLLETTLDSEGLPKLKWALPVVGQTFVGREEWAMRGAANAGIAVLLYLQEIKAGKIKPVPTYDHCEQLKK